MRTLHVGLRVADRARSVAFYTAVGYHVVGGVPDTEIGELTMLQLPGDEFVSLELVHHPPAGPVEAGGTSSWGGGFMAPLTLAVFVLGITERHPSRTEPRTRCRTRPPAAG